MHRWCSWRRRYGALRTGSVRNARDSSAMADTADDPTGRALALLARLTSRPHWSGAELAGHLGVTTRTVRRDIERLRRLGYDIDASPGTDGGYRLRAGDTAAPVFLDDDESVAIVTALLAAVATESTGMVDASLRALAKLHHVVPAPARGSVDAVQRSTRSVARGRGPEVAPARRRRPRRGVSRQPGRPLRLPGARRRRLAAPGRAERARHRGRRLVPHRLRPRPSRLAPLPRRPHAGRRGHRARHRPAPVAGRRRDGVPRRVARRHAVPVQRRGRHRPARRCRARRPRLAQPAARRGDRSAPLPRCASARPTVEDLVEELLDVVRLGAPTTIDAPPEVRQRLAEVAAAVSAAVTGR